MKGIQSRGRLGVLARRASRTVAAALSVAVAFCLVFIYIVFQAADLLEAPIIGPILVWLLVAALAVVVGLGTPLLGMRAISAARFAAARRGSRSGLQAWADQRGWEVAESAERRAPGIAWSVLRALEQLEAKTLTPVVGQPDRVRVRDFAHGRDEQDRTWVTFSASKLGAPDFHRRFLAATMERLPSVTITDRSLDEAWLTPQQRFESTHFNQRWRVSADDPRYASDVVHARLMEVFVDSPLSFERVDLAQGWAISWLPARVDPATLDEHARLLRRIADLVPRFVLTDRG